MSGSDSSLSISNDDVFDLDILYHLVRLMLFRDRSNPRRNETIFMLNVDLNMLL